MARRVGKALSAPRGPLPRDEKFVLALSVVKARGLSLKKVAEDTGIDYGKLRRWASKGIGHARGDESREEVEKLFDHLGIPSPLEPPSWRGDTYPDSEQLAEYICTIYQTCWWWKATDLYTENMAGLLHELQRQVAIVRAASVCARAQNLGSKGFRSMVEWCQEVRAQDKEGYLQALRENF